MEDARRGNLADRVFRELKNAIFDFVLLPGERFSENEVATRLRVSRTPVREALYKLQREGYIDVAPRSGWNVRPFDFAVLEDLYDLRTVLELAAAERMCAAERVPEIAELRQAWIVPAGKRLRDPWKVAQLDERFHETIVKAAHNRQMSPCIATSPSASASCAGSTSPSPSAFGTRTRSTPPSCARCLPGATAKQSSC